MKKLRDNSTRLLLTSAIVLGMSVSGCSSSDSDPDTSEIPEDIQTEEPNSNDNSVAIGRTSTTSIGEVLVAGEANRTLYTFANDTDNVSNCTGGCLQNWPAVLAGTAITIGSFSTIERDDGSVQWTFKNRPVYYYQGDASEGDVAGEGLGMVWYVARPDPIGIGETTEGTVLVGLGSVRSGNESSDQRSDRDGRSLYTFRNDSANTSTCIDQCAINWPPLYADVGALPADEYDLITRPDGSMQWAQDGQPLYFYSADSAAGDINGDGLGGVWDLAVPAN